MSNIMRVSTKSNPNSIAGAVVAVITSGESNTVEINTVGAGAVNQAVKAIAIARGFVASRGKDLVCQPHFNNFTVEGEERTGLTLVIEMKDTRN